MPDIKILNPDSLGKPLGQYSQITRVKASEFLFIAGQVGAAKDGKTPADFDGPVRADLRQHRRGAELAGRGLRQRRRVHHLSRAFAGHSEVHGVPHTRISQAVRRGRLPAQHAADVDRLVKEEFLIEVSAVAAL